MNDTGLHRDDLPCDGNAYGFQQFQHDVKNVSCTVSSFTLEAHAGQIIIVPAEVPQKFLNLSDQRLKQVDIHASKQFITHWLED